MPLKAPSFINIYRWFARSLYEHRNNDEAQESGKEGEEKPTQYRCWHWAEEAEGKLCADCRLLRRRGMSRNELM